MRKDTHGLSGRLCRPMPAGCQRSQENGTTRALTSAEAYRSLPTARRTAKGGTFSVERVGHTRKFLDFRNVRL